MIYIVSTSRKIGTNLEKALSLASKECRCLTLDEISERSKAFLGAQGVDIIYEKEINRNTREKFLKEYIDAIGGLGGGQDGLLWWATDISSRNRFRTNLPDLVWRYISILDVIERNGSGDLIIIGLITDLLPAIKKYFKDKNIRCREVGGSLKRRLLRVIFLSRKILSVMFNAFRFYSRSIYARIALGNKVIGSLVGDEESYVVKTFIYDHSFSGQGDYRDVFFGKLPEYLRSKKKLVIYANILGRFRYSIKKIQECKDAVIVPIEMFTSLWDVLAGIGQVLFYKVKVRENIELNGRDISYLLSGAFEHPFTGIQMGQFLHYKATKNFAKKVPIKTVLLSYENNPWEKMCMKAVREASPNAKIIGYQHNVVPQASLNMFISREELPCIPKPDVVLTTGDIPKKIMERYGSLNHNSIKASCALRHEYLFQANGNLHKPEGKTLLLALEGIFDVYRLVNYVIGQLHDRPEYRIIVRTHPVLPVARFKHKLLFDLGALEHVEISSGVSLKDDIERSDIVIYWGSTVGMEALWLGKPVIHFDNGSILGYDPLFECSDLKWTAGKNDTLLPILNEIETMNAEQYEFHRRQAKSYLEKYFHPVTEENLISFCL